MLTRAQANAIREHVELDEPIRRLISLATTDLYHGPIITAEEHGDEADAYPGFVAACRMIGDAMPRSDLYIDLDVDEVIGEIEPLFDNVLHVDNRDVVRVLVGAELSRYV
jgi:hypothetical protein